jgi:hypothetical protein
MALRGRRLLLPWAETARQVYAAERLLDQARVVRNWRALNRVMIGANWLTSPLIAFTAAEAAEPGEPPPERSEVIAVAAGAFQEVVRPFERGWLRFHRATARGSSSTTVSSCLWRLTLKALT